MSDINKILKRLGEDGIHSRGITDGWEWIKYMDGRAMAIKHSQITTSITRQYGSMYTESFSISFPFSFVKEPLFVGSHRGGGALATYSPQTLSTIAGNFFIWYPLKYTSVSTFLYTFSIEGVWK